ncbi:MAG: 23S rRNA (uracil(1939)-C(5))-methyltransferase RlmD [Candidatus Gracilibacteria bacterium]|jgi:23S rRNA (uracil1939-C5)-methyltransferase
MNLQKGEIIDLEIENIAFLGKGVGKYNGKVVFVSNTMAGDKIKASLTHIKKDFCEADLVEIVKPSSERIAPKCEYFDKCGGCSFQFITYAKQLEIKKQHVIDAFERIGNVVDPNVKDVIGCSDPYYYRNKMEFSFGYDANMNFTLGMHEPNRRFDIMDLKNCYLMSKISVDIFNLFREFCVRKNYEPFKYSNGSGFLKQVFVREGKRTNEVMVNFVTSDLVPKDFENDLNELKEELLKCHEGEKKLTSFYWSKVISQKGRRREIKETLVYGKKYLTEILKLENGDSLTFDIAPQAFFQVNTFGAEILYNLALKYALKNPHETVFDLFCGTGTIGLFLAKHINEVFGIEINEDAVIAARENAQKNKIFNIDFFTGDVDKVLKKITRIPSLIVIDPPRAGLTKNTIEKINEFGAKSLIYISCNPSTLARDCQMLREYGFKISEITPVDMFPHTYHIECVCLFER